MLIISVLWRSLTVFVLIVNHLVVGVLIMSLMSFYGDLILIVSGNIFIIHLLCLELLVWLWLLDS